MYKTKNHPQAVRVPRLRMPVSGSYVIITKVNDLGLEDQPDGFRSFNHTAIRDFLRGKITRSLPEHLAENA